MCQKGIKDCDRAQLTDQAEFRIKFYSKYALMWSAMHIRIYLVKKEMHLSFLFIFWGPIAYHFQKALDITHLPEAEGFRHWGGEI